MKKKFERKLYILIFLEVSTLFLFLVMFFSIGSAGVGNNVSISTILDVGSSAPEIVNITFLDSVSGIDLIANSTKTVEVLAILRDYNGESDVSNISMEFYDSSISFYGDGDDKNYHYTNLSCEKNLSYGDFSELNVTCRFDVWYYANNQTWNASLFIKDQSGLDDFSSEQAKINTLLALGVPDEINYGLVNATNVSDEKEVNVTNYGNVKINLSLEGYAVTQGDGWAMNCSLGNPGNISIGYEKYNLTSSNLTLSGLSEFEGWYSNLTNDSVIEEYGLNYRFNDTDNEAYNSTYWRIYVPPGVAGTCTGNIIIGATTASG
jgi:hypothetical protein